MTPAPIAALMTALLTPLAPAPSPGTDTFTRMFSFDRTGEVVARVRAGCARCDWGAAGGGAAGLPPSGGRARSRRLFASPAADPAAFHRRPRPAPPRPSR